MFDLIIFGSGFSGSLLSMVAHRLGLRVLLIERGVHPRFAIGESTSPLTNLLLEELALEYDLPFLLPFTTLGTWQRNYPKIAVGKKRGFTYYHHRANQDFDRAPDRSSQLLVAASTSDEDSDTHWFRADFDAFLVERAIELGVDYGDNTEVASVEREPAGWVVSGSGSGGEFTVRAKFIVDATGPRGLFHRLLQTGESSFPDFPERRGLFGHFECVRRCDEMPSFETPGTPVFAPDDAALHHLFDGGWMWVLRFNNDITSAGVSITQEIAAELGEPNKPEEMWRRFLSRYPTISAQFSAAKPVQPFRYARKLSYRTRNAAGVGWAMLPSAAAFIDPLFSTGIPLTLLGIQRLGKLLEQFTSAGILTGNGLQPALSAYGELTLAEADAAAEFVGASLRALPNMRVFTAFSMFYFAAASFSEMARRLDRHRLVTRFLAADRHDFRSGMKRCTEAMQTVLHDPTESNLLAFERLVAESIDCLNVAGLADASKRNWYGVDLQDVVNNCHKLDIDKAELQAIIETAPWAQF